MSSSLVLLLAVLFCVHSQGFCDLKLGLIRTPLEPRVTLLDDPLRVLRAVRFSARYGFEMVPELQDAVALEEVRVG